MLDFVHHQGDASYHESWKNLVEEELCKNLNKEKEFRQFCCGAFWEWIIMGTGWTILRGVDLGEATQKRDEGWKVNWVETASIKSIKLHMRDSR